MKYPKINYIGNKEKIVSWICDNFPDDVNSVFDAFSGGASVSYECKKRGYQVTTNDILKINYLLSKAIIENNNVTLSDEDLEIIFQGKSKKGFMYENYSNVFFYPEECMEIDQYKENIEMLDSEYKKALAYSLLRRAMIRKMPYSRFNLSWEKIKLLRNEEYSYEKYKRKRAYHNLSIKKHFMDNLKEYNSSVFNNKQNNVAHNLDVFEIVDSVSADLIYLDPPYTGTMNNYFGFYGMIDEFLYNKKLKPFENNFISKKEALFLFDKLFSKLKNYKYWVLSYNNSSYPSKEELLKLLSKYSNNVKIIEKNHSYQVTGKANKNKSKEYLFIILNENYINDKTEV